MSGAVGAFTPAGSTIAMSVTNTSGTLAFIPSDELLIYNAGTADVFAVLGAASETLSAIVPTGTTLGGFPLKAGTVRLVDTQGVPGVSTSRIVQIGAITVSGGSTLYLTPGRGTQY